MVKGTEKKNIVSRPPIIVVMGHVDHGKSTLLDYIRKTNIVADESGGITQHISAYEVEHTNKKGDVYKITFLDTPGHEAFSAMRTRGAGVADMAILIVSAEDGVKTQTLEAYNAIREACIPFIIAINKIDKPNADSNKIKNELLENEIYLEGCGGDVPFVEISAKTGQGVPELLDMMLLVAEMEELTADKNSPAEGIVIESHVDPKKGISASLIITNGVLKKNMGIAVGSACTPVRVIENFLGKIVDESSFSSPIRITGFNDIPEVGMSFVSFDSKKEAEKYAAQCAKTQQGKKIIGNDNSEIVVPLVIKADVLGSIDAIINEISKLKPEKVALKIIEAGVGDISENDIKIASGSSNAIIVGFRITADRRAMDMAEKLSIPIKTFAIIYNITDYIEDIVRERTPKEEVEEASGEARVIRVFSKAKDKQVIGGSVLSGQLDIGSRVKIQRRGTDIGTGSVIELQQQKMKADTVKEGSEFGAMLESRTEIAENDTLVPFVITTK